MYNRLLEPGKIGNLVLKNRVVMPAMGTSLANSDGTASEEIIAFYEERAIGGCGLIITEITRVNSDTGVGTPNQLSVTDPYQVQKLERLCRSVHRHGSKIFFQLQHPGRQSHGRLIGKQIVGASDIPCKTIGEVPRALTTEEVEDMVKEFIKGARIGQMSGVDGIELHAAHGYLLCQFLSPATNNRTDKYGGSFENRHRMLAEIIMGIKHVCGKNFPISVRIDGDEFVEGGISLEEAIETAKYLEALGVDAINVSSGSYESANTIIEPYSYKTGWKKYLATAIREVIEIPVIAVNTIKTPEDAEGFLEEGVCDFVGIGRGLLADPHFINKVSENRVEDIRPCIGCLYCIESLMSGYALKCAVNPKLGYESDYRKLNKNGNREKVVVIGGGPAGLEAAITLAERNFEVILFEERAQLGGSAFIGTIPPHKELLGKLISYLELQADKFNIDIRLNTRADLETIKEVNPCAVYIAMGGDDIVIPLTDSKSGKVLNAIKTLENKIKLENKDIVVIGSGMTGLETAEYFAEQGNNVKVIEMLPEIGPGIHKALLFDVVSRLKSMGVEFLSNTKLKDYKDNKSIVIDLESNDELGINADYCILSIGVKNKQGNEFIEEIEGNFKNVFNIGDSNSTGRIYEAMVSGLDRAYTFKN